MKRFYWGIVGRWLHTDRYSSPAEAAQDTARVYLQEHPEFGLVHTDVMRYVQVSHKKRPTPKRIPWWLDAGAKVKVVGLL